MHNPYKTPESQLTRDREVLQPYIVPLMCTLVATIHIGYLLYFLQKTSSTIGIISLSQHNIFVLCMSFTLVYWAMLLALKTKMDVFSNNHPIILEPDDLIELKRIIRINMYSALIAIPLLLAIALTSVMSVVPLNGVMSIMVIITGFGTSSLINWVKCSENTIRNIGSHQDIFENEIDSLIQCWFRKAFPDF